ncbi:DUF3139 domain-containing protein [Listeria monocytogenes]|nr:DUF3139 domain-containing protein [Listeria monocytogenes]EKA3544480.1 DUF3139 domain-containing protein [Listeria monocytogenes]EKA5246592.1 DUF3139 domain-containing protein [Listeria monocytogenes]EKA5253868.1 DUF3139 domain-containing protein [Listeria monocytogenes]EKA5340271.1 DUF3139 domain-containing protein [Listeria monocytogenes]
MKKYKKWWITIGIIFLLSVIGYVYWFAIPKNTANKAVGNYLAEQKIKSNQIETRVIKKDWKMGGYLTKIVFKDGSSQEDDQVKHPPLQEQND